MRRAGGPVVVAVLATILASVLVSNRAAVAPAVTGSTKSARGALTPTT